MTAKPALAGRRVLELGAYIAGPFAGHMLAQLGADVIKVEPPAGDPTRTMARGGASGTFIAYGSGKRSICIDLRAPEGNALFRRLVAATDVVLHNLAPDSAKKLKVTFEDCRAANPDVVYCQIKGYGPGPLEDDVASNPVIEAATGVMYSHRIEGKPARLGPSYHDMFAGAHAVVGILAALMSSDRDSERSRIEVGLYETGLYVAARDLVAEQLNAAVPRDKPPAEFAFPGYGAYQTSEGRWIYLVMLADDHWSQFCTAMSLPDGTDPSLLTTRQRRKRGPYVEALVTRTIRELTFDEAATRLRSVGFGYTEVKAPGDVLDDPQAQHPGKVAALEFQGRRYRVPNFPVLSGSVRAGVSVPPPLLGQHTLEILGSLGYARSECDLLLSKGVVLASDEALTRSEG